MGAEKDCGSWTHLSEPSTLCMWGMANPVIFIILSHQGQRGRLFIHSTHLLSTFYVPGTVLGAGHE